MSPLVSVASVLGALTLGAMSPGPSFVMVARISMGSTRRNGLAAACGMGMGGVVFAGLALWGMQSLLASAPRAYFWLRIAGAFYLLYLAIRFWRDATTQIDDTGKVIVHTTPRASFGRGLLTQLSNPKTAVVYGSIFAALLPPDLPTAALVALPCLVFAIETGWYSLVALALSSAASRQFYLRSRAVVDRCAGSVIAVLGAKLLFTVLHATPVLPPNS